MIETPFEKISVEVDLKTPEDILKRGIQLLDLYPGISIEPKGGPVETQVTQIESTIREIVQKRIEGLETRLNVTYSILDKTLSWLIPEIEQTWQIEFMEQPAIGILNLPEYLLRMNQLEQDVGQHFGKCSFMTFPPYAYISPYRGLILFPLEIPLGFSERCTVGTGWDIAHFQEVLCGILSQALFRQVRREWRSDYVTAIKSFQSEFLRTHLLNDIIAQYVKEEIALKHPEWALYAFLDQVGVVWRGEQMQMSGENRIQEYAAIDALKNRTNIYRTAMVDDIEVLVGQKKVVASFNPHHPYNLMKQKVFGGEK